MWPHPSKVIAEMRASSPIFIGHYGVELRFVTSRSLSFRCAYSTVTPSFSSLGVDVAEVMLNSFATVGSSL
jgi:hypothetical protein